MNNSIDVFINLASTHEILAYFLLFLGVFIEGEFVLILAGIIVHLGGLNLSWVLGISLLGAYSKSIIWYFLGYFLGNKYPNSRFFKYLEKRVLNFFPHLKEKPFWSIFASKFIYGIPGINHFLLAFVGYMRIKFSYYLKAEFSSSTIWVFLMTLLGYFFSYTALGISREFKNFILIILAFTIGFFILEKIIGYLYRHYEKWQKHLN